MATSENKSDKKATTKATSKKTAPAAKPVAAKKPTAKAASSKKTAVSKQSPTLQTPSAEERYRMTEVAAYFMAERNSFAGSPVEYWQAAEAQINSMLGQK